jgi:hypothetical protein
VRSRQVQFCGGGVHKGLALERVGFLRGISGLPLFSCGQIPSAAGAVEGRRGGSRKKEFCADSIILTTPRFCLALFSCIFSANLFWGEQAVDMSSALPGFCRVCGPQNQSPNCFSSAQAQTLELRGERTEIPTVPKIDCRARDNPLHCIRGPSLK